MTVLSTLAFEVAWQEIVGGPHHVALRCESPGRTWTERAEYVAKARAELDTDLSALRVFDRPDQELYGWYGSGAERNAVVAVARGRRGAVARRVGDRVTLRSCHPDQLAAAVLAGLPAATPLAVNVTVPLGDEPDEFADPLCGGDKYPELLFAPRSGAGEFYAARRDRAGHRTRAEFPVGYADTVDGRYVTTLRRSPDGVVWLTLAPASVFHAQLVELAQP